MYFVVYFIDNSFLIRLCVESHTKAFKLTYSLKIIVIFVLNYVERKMFVLAK